jgi:hypothetical protein
MAQVRVAIAPSLKPERMKKKPRRFRRGFPKPVPY